MKINCFLLIILLLTGCSSGKKDGYLGYWKEVQIKQKRNIEPVALHIYKAGDSYFAGIMLYHFF